MRAWRVQSIDLALSGSRAVAAIGGEVLSSADCNLAHPDAFTDLLSGLNELTNTRRMRVYLTPALCEVRLLDLPPLARESAVHAIERDAVRYFHANVHPLVVDCLPAGVAYGPALVAAASRDLLERLHLEAQSAGWKIDYIGSMYERWQPGTRGDTIVVVPLDGIIEVLFFEDDRIRELRRLPSDRTDLIEAVLQCDLPHTIVTDALTAAATSSATTELHLETSELRASRQRRARRRMQVSWVVTVALLAGAALIENWGLGREVESLRSARKDVWTAAQNAQTAFSEHQAHAELAAAVSELEAARSHWWQLLLEIARSLPADARLAGFQAGSEKAVIELVTPDAVATIEALKEVVAFRDLQVVGNIRRRTGEDGSNVEHVAVAAPAITRRGK